jgi:hypothetical protein
MALSGFEIATGGITSIPVTATLIFLGYKAFGEKNLDTTKYKPKKPVQTKKTGPSKETSEPKKTDVSKKDTDTTKSATEEESITIKKIPNDKTLKSKKSIDIKD